MVCFVVSYKPTSGDVMQYAIISINVDYDLLRHMAFPVRNDFLWRCINILP